MGVSVTSEVFAMVVLAAGEQSLDEEGGDRHDDKHTDHAPRVPAGLELGPALGKQQQVVHHRTELEKVVERPGNLEGTEDRRSDHEEPLLDEERHDADQNGNGHGNKHRDPNMGLEIGNVNGGKHKP